MKAVSYNQRNEEHRKAPTGPCTGSLGTCGLTEPLVTAEVLLIGSARVKRSQRVLSSLIL